MFRDNYSNLYNQIRPSEELINTTLECTQKIEKSNRRVIYRHRKLLIVAAIICLCAVLTVTPVFAAANDFVYTVMYQISPQMAQFFTPVQKSCESKGVEMSVLACYIHDDTAEIYVSMRDTGANIVDEKLDLFDSYSINTPFDSSAHCQRVDYDESSRTATFLITISQWGEQDIVGDKLTFTVRSLLYGKNAYEDYVVPIDLSKIEKSPKTQKQYVQLENIKDAEMEMLAEQDTYKDATDFGKMSFSGIGYVDGCLHIQMKYEDYTENDNHCWIYLHDKREDFPKYRNDDLPDGYTAHGLYEPNDLYNEYSVTWYDGNIRYDETVIEPNSDYSFEEFVNEISNYEIVGDFYTTNDAYHGNWKITFPIENMNTDEITDKSEPTTEPETEPEFELKTLDPVSKEDYINKMLNSVDFYNEVSGKIETNMNNGDIDNIEYSLNFNDGKSYEHTTSNDCDNETYVQYGQQFIFDNINKTQNKRIIIEKLKSDENYAVHFNSGFQTDYGADFMYDKDFTGINVSSGLSIYPRQLVNDLMYDFNLWEVGDRITYLSRDCQIIKGNIPSEFQYSFGNAETFKLIMDRETGIMLDLECYTPNGIVTSYTHTTNISFDNVEVKDFDREKYAQYKLE